MKNKKYIGGSILLLFIIVFLIAITDIDSSAAEFHESRLPSQMFPQSYNRSPEQTTTTNSSVVQNDIYEKFRQDVKKRTPQDRKRLKEGFEQKAKQTRNRTEQAYYYRLIAILCEAGIK